MTFWYRLIRVLTLVAVLLAAAMAWGVYMGEIK